MFNRLVCNPPVSVEVADESPLKFEAATRPVTDKAAYGEVVPIPTLPALVIIKAAGVEVPYESVEVPT